MSLKGFSFYLFLTALLTILLVNEKNYLLLIPLLVIFIIFIKKYGFALFLLLVTVFGIFSFYKVNKVDEVNTTYIQEEFVVLTTKEKYLIVENDEIKYLIYYDKQDISVDDEVYIQGQVKKLEKDLELDVFEFSSYLAHQRVYYEIEIYDIKIIQANQSFSNKIKDYLLSNLENESYVMCKMLLFNDKYASIENYNDLKEINALHLFVVSGFHISFFYTLITKLFKKHEKLGVFIGLSICLFYVFLLDFSISATRAFLSLLLSKCFFKFFNQLDIISIPGIILLVIEPLNVYNYSFILSFLMVFTIAFITKFISKQNKIIQAILLSFICFIAMIPIQLIINYKINFISLITNVLLSYVVMVIFVMCLFSIIFSYFNGNIFSIVYQKFFDVIDKISNLNTSIVFGSIKIEFLILYYIIFILLLFFIERKKYKQSLLFFSFLLTFMVCLYNRHYFVFYQQVTFLNVYQGDCTIIQDSYNGKVMLIDTGGLNNYDIANKKIMPYLNYHGIRKIDIVVLTHDDYDHCGALNELADEILIDKIITNNDDVSNITLGKIVLTNINVSYKNATTDNDKSLVLYGNICSLNFLFTGDVSYTIEKEIVNTFENLQVDVLKVAHHGSKYSTSSEFVSSINPSIAIISVGKNYYGHPSEEVLETLNKFDIKIYRTDKEGTIKIKGKIFDNWFIESAK